MPDALPNTVHCMSKLKFLKMRGDIGIRLSLRSHLYGTLQICRGHLHHARDQVTEAVGEVRGVPLVKLLPGHVGVFSRVHVSKEKVARRVGTVFLYELIR